MGWACVLTKDKGRSTLPDTAALGLQLGYSTACSLQTSFSGHLRNLGSPGHCLPLLPLGGGSLQPGRELGTRLGLEAPPGSCMFFASDTPCLSLSILT